MKIDNSNKKDYYNVNPFIGISWLNSYSSASSSISTLKSEREENREIWKQGCSGKRT